MRPLCSACGPIAELIIQPRDAAWWDYWTVVFDHLTGPAHQAMVALTHSEARVEFHAGIR